MFVGWISHFCYSYIISSWNHIGLLHKNGVLYLVVLVLGCLIQRTCHIEGTNCLSHVHNVQGHAAVWWQHWHLQEGCLEFERTKWYDSLILYGLKEGETEDGLKQDPDLKLVPVIIEKVLLPKLTRKCLVHCDCYWQVESVQFSYWQVVSVQFCLLCACLSTPPPTPANDIQAKVMWCKWSGMQVVRHAGGQACKWSGMQVVRHASNAQ